MRLRTRRRVGVALGLVAAVALGSAACSRKDPRERALQERGRWTVGLQSFVQRPDGGVTAAVRLTGPTKTPLHTLTVRITMRGTGDRELASLWHSFPLDDIVNGGPVDRMIDLPAVGETVESVALDPVLRPSVDDVVHIAELAGL